MTLPEDPGNLFIPEYKLAEMSLSELFSRAKSVSSLKDVTAWLEFHKKLSYNLLGLPLLLLGLFIFLFVY